MASPSYLTKEGVEKYRAELNDLEGPVRLDLAKRLRAAIQMGDLSENADYSAAKEEQAFIEGRILELTNLLRDVILIDDLPIGSEVVNIGSQVTICEEGETDEETYMLVGPKESDPKNGRISFDSPIGSALMGKKVNDLIIVSTPAGEIKFKVLKVA